MLHPLRPGHFANVDQALDALFQLDKRAVVGHANYAAANMRADGITLRSVKPRIGSELLESQGYALLVAIELQHLYLDLVADLHQIARMGEASPRHIGDVQQAIDATEI